MNKSRTIRVLRVPIGDSPEVAWIGSDLQSMQAEVGGYIEMIEWLPEVDLVCNEEGKIEGLPINRRLGDWDVLVGTAFFVRHDEEGEPASLTDDDVRQLLALIDAYQIRSAPESVWEEEENGS